MARKTAKNKFQKRQQRRGEDRLRGDKIDLYLSMAYSDDPEDRVAAMDNLCPCHVRRRIDAVWEALYRGLQDSDINVRRAAWHTLDDGGRPNDPQLQPILEKVAKKETDPKLRQRAIDLIQSVKQVEDKHGELVGQRADYFRGKCDWCGEANVQVTYDYETEFEGAGGQKRFALMCPDCAGVSP